MAERPDPLEEQIDAIRAELTRRVADVQRRNTRTNVVAGSLVVLILAYFAWMTRYISHHLTPDGVVASLYGQALVQLPSLSEETTQALRDSAPVLVAEMLRTVGTSVPQLRKSAQAQFDLLLEEAFLQMGRQLEAMGPSLFLNQPDALTRLTQPLGEQELRSIAHELGETLIASLEAEGVDDDMLQQIHTKMWAVHNELNTLRRGGPKLTEIQRLEKRFIELAIQLLRREAS